MRESYFAPWYYGRMDRFQRIEASRRTRLAVRTLDDSPREYIYALCCPDTGEIRYVGRTINPRRRFREHMLRSDVWKVRDWFLSCHELGKKPSMIILAIVNRKYAGREETKAIEHFAKTLKLLNCQERKWPHVSRIADRETFKRMSIFLDTAS